VVTLVEEMVTKTFEKLKDSMGMAFMVAAQEVTKEKRQETALQNHQDTLFKAPQHPFVGNPSAQKTAVVFTDPYCSHCHESLNAFEAYSLKAPHIKVIIHNYPLFGKGSRDATEALLAAHLQSQYLAFYKAFQKKIAQKKKMLTPAELLAIAKSLEINVTKFRKDLKGPEVKAILKHSILMAKDFNVTATPTFILEKTLKGETSQVVEGAIPPEKCFEEEKA
jgi:protein-disulfide isomerase